MNTATRGFVASGSCIMLLHEAERRGLSSSEVLRQARMPVERIHAVGGLVPGVEALRLCRVLRRRTNDPDFGLWAGAGAQISTLGLAGLLLRSSEDGRSAYAAFERWAGSALPGVEVDVDPQAFVVRYVLELGPGTPRVFHDVVLAAVHSVAREITGSSHTQRVEFGYPRPAATEVYQEVFAAPVAFDASVSRCVFSPETITTSLPFHDPLVADMVGRYLDPLTGQHPETNLLEQVRHILLTGEPDRPLPGIEEVADVLALSPRTLRRRLQAEGANFQSLLEEAKREIALTALAQTPDLPGKDLAARLGYSDAPAFYRAIKRWTGQSLTEYRAQADPS